MSAVEKAGQTAERSDSEYRGPKAERDTIFVKQTHTVVVCAS